MGVSSDQAPSLLQQHSGSSNSGSSGEFPPPPPPTKRLLQNHQESEKLKCPRCASANTKFCYYNNYNKSQPRHFCKSCRRYWTEGGTLRNVPVGGGRKNKRLKPPAAATKASNILATSYECMNRITQMETQAQNPKKGLISLGFGLEDEIGSCINGAIGGSSLSFPGDHELQFPSPISGYVSDLYSNGESGALKETAMAGVEPCLSLSSLNDQPWTYMESINSSWVWDDIDKFVSSDVSMPWDDAEIN